MTETVELRMKIVIPKYQDQDDRVVEALKKAVGCFNDIDGPQGTLIFRSTEGEDLSFYVSKRVFGPKIPWVIEATSASPDADDERGRHNGTSEITLKKAAALFERFGDGNVKL